MTLPSGVRPKAVEKKACYDSKRNIALNAKSPLLSYPLALAPEQAGLCRVLDAQGLHVGNLKLIGAVWKFKAIGYGAGGELIPGGGPLTERHNTGFDKLDANQINAVLGSSQP